jgi:pimeloyl-ACP methyl ester carboxylesterase
VNTVATKDTFDVAVHTVTIEVEGRFLDGDLSLPASAHGLIIFAHGSGSSRLSPRNRFVARALHNARFGTLLLDLLTDAEDRIDERTRALRFDIPLLASRLEAATVWALDQAATATLPIGYFGASTGAAAALIAAAQQPSVIRAVVSRGGRPDLAGSALRQVRAPTLLIVGGDDLDVLRLNYQAQQELAGLNALHVVPGATHLFEEPGALEEVTERARDWLEHYV